MKFSLTPISFEAACRFVADHHRHRSPPRGHKFSLAAASDGFVVGVIMVGRPVARLRDDGLTLEVTRLAVLPDLPPVIDRQGRAHAAPVCSFLYGAAARAAFALGYKRVGSYILESETGATLRAAGWRLVGETKGRSWSCSSRPRAAQQFIENKLLFEVAA